MIGLLIRKAFFDSWDNLALAFVFNVVADIAVFGALGGAAAVSSYGLGAMIAVLLPGVLLVALVGGVINRFTWNISRQERFTPGELGGFWRQSWKTSLFLGVLALLSLAGVTLGLPFYAALHSTYGVVLFGVLIWLLVLLFLLVQFYWPMNAQIEPQIGKLLRKCLLLFIDNPGLTIFLLISSALLTALSLLTAGLFPGFVGVLLWNQTAVKLLLYKYDYLETLPEDQRRRKAKIPWAMLLKEESEKVGKRSLKGMFFPWKD